MFNKRGQGSLEIAVVFVCLFLLIGGIMKMWFWMNYNIVRRQQKYNETRRDAGTSPVGLAASYQEQWPAKDDGFHDVPLDGRWDPFYVGLNAKEP